MEIGEHCFFKSCKRLDFLPFTCEQCKGVFCKEHRFPHQHDCDHPPSSSSQDDPDITESGKAIRSFGCSINGCPRKEMMELKCPHCSNAFCLQHRQPVDHSCLELPRKPANPGRGRGGGRGVVSPPAADRGGQTGLTPQPGAWSSAKAARLESTKNKVFLMKLKMKADGSDAIPMTERLYYQVHLPAGGKEDDGSAVKPMFFSKEWSIGKIVDYIAQRHKLKNENNQPHPKQKLIVCTAESDEALSMSKPLKSFQDSTLPNGATMKLVYIS